MPPAPASPNRRHLASAIVDLLHDEFDPREKLLVASFEPENGQIFENEDRLSNRALTVRGLAGFLESQPFLYAAFMRDESAECRETWRGRS